MPALNLRHSVFLPLILAAALVAPAALAQGLADPAVKTVDLTRVPVERAMPGGLPQQEFRTADAFYSGRFRLDQQTGNITGELSVQWNDGSRYQGSMVDGKRQGRGRFTWPNGQYYEGDWRNNAATGKGVIRFANGDQYEGEVVDGLPEGQGSKTYAAGGDRYTGRWQAGLRHGQGRFVWANGQTYVGEWRKDAADGQGQITFPNGDSYQGAVQAGLPQGRGVRQFANGERYTGEFLNGQPHGQGAYLWNSGDRYDGQWQAGQRNGQGRYTWPDGDYWEGRFVAERQAEGRLHFSPRLSAEAPGAALVLQTVRTASQAVLVSPALINPARLAQIPLVAAELTPCRQPGARDNCRQLILDEIAAGRYFEHRWQALPGEAGQEIDRQANAQDGLAFTWLRFADAKGGNFRKAGLQYDCRSQSLQIQLLFVCNASQCLLDPLLDRHAGQSIPASNLHNWFRSACARSQ